MFDDINWYYLLGTICIDILIMAIMEFFDSLKRKILIIVLMFCLFCIVTIGLDICLFPFPSLSDYVPGINNILINLSYSYVAGYILYWFTVIIPEKRDKEIVLPLIKNEIISLWSPIESLFNWYIAFSATEQVKPTEEEVLKAIHENYSKYKVYDYIPPQKRIDYTDLLKIRLDEFKDKAIFLSQKSRYFTAEQFNCLNVIINENYNPFSTLANSCAPNQDIPEAMKNIVSAQLWKIIKDYINLRESFGIKDDLFLNSIFTRKKGTFTVKRKTANNSQNNNP